MGRIWALRGIFRTRGTGAAERGGGEGWRQDRAGNDNGDPPTLGESPKSTESGKSTESESCPKVESRKLLL